MIRNILHYRQIALLMLCITLTACVSQTVNTTTVPNVNTASTEIPEDLLLDIDISLFDPGLENYDEGQQVYPEVRHAESNYLPNLLLEALQNSGAWGAVRVVPVANQIADLMIESKILYSDGEELRLHITAIDSRGQVWLDKEYQSHAGRYSYYSTSRAYQDPFQAVYNNIANDLFDKQLELQPEERENIRLVSELLFARSFSPEAFGTYIGKSSKGIYQLRRLPAEDDPMLARVRSIRDRDMLFVDTMQEFFLGFNEEMFAPYQEWRRLSYEDAIALQKLKTESTRRLLAGGLAVVAGIVGSGSSSSAIRAASSVAVIGGGFLVKSGMEKRNEAEMHVASLEELGQSLGAEITPQVIELQDRTVTLSGTVEDQYAQWRELLAEIYRSEIGELELPDSDATLTDSL